MRPGDKPLTVGELREVIDKIVRDGGSDQSAVVCECDEYCWNAVRCEIDTGGDLHLYAYNPEGE